MMAVLTHVLHRSSPMNCCRVGASFKAIASVVIGMAQDTIMNAACVEVRNAFFREQRLALRLARRQANSYAKHAVRQQPQQREP